MKPEIRRLGSGDVAWLRQLNAMFAEAFDDPATYVQAPPGSDHCERLLKRDELIVLIASEGDAVVGGLVAYDLVKIEQACSEVYIYDLAVAERWRRKGIATGLIDHLKGIARDIGAWVVYVQADLDDPPAIALYTKLGTREDVLHFDIAIPAG